MDLPAPQHTPSSGQMLEPYHTSMTERHPCANLGQGYACVFQQNVTLPIWIPEQDMQPLTEDSKDIKENSQVLSSGI